MFKLAKDSWTSQEYTISKTGLLSFDKAQHYIAGFFLGLLSPWVALIILFIWEVKDGFLDWRKNIVSNLFFIDDYNLGGD